MANKIQVSFNGMIAEYYEINAGAPVLVFLNDSLGCIELWRDFPLKLANATQCNVLVYDRLGYGKSDPMLTHIRTVNYLEHEANSLNELLVHIDINNAILFGHSDGGSIALIAAAKYPERIKAIVCEAAHIFVEDITIAGIRAVMEMYETTNLAERLAKYHGSKVDMLFRAWTETWTRDDFRNWNIEHFLPAITCPLRFIQGEADEYGSILQVEKTIAGTSGKTKSVTLPGVGHTPHKEAPAFTLDACAAFINSLA